MLVLGVILLYSSNDLLALLPLVYKLITFGVIWLFTLILPVVSFWVLKRTGQLSDFTMADKKERIIPMLLTLTSFIAAFILLVKFKVPEVVLRFMIGAAITLIIATIVTVFWKISAHMMGAGGFAATIFMLSLVFNLNLFWLLSLVIFIGGITGWARLTLNAHNYLQLLAGYLTGWGIMIFCFFDMT